MTDDQISAVSIYSLFGTLEIDGVGIYYCFSRQSRTTKTWCLTERTVYDESPTTGKPRGNDDLVSVLRITSTGRMTGWGKTYYLTRLLDSISTMVGRAAATKAITSGFITQGEYVDEHQGDFIKFKANMSGSIYTDVQMTYDGFTLSVSTMTNRTLPFVIPELLQVEDAKSKAAVVAGLGVRTFALLKRRMGHELDWYDKKTYKLIQTDDEFDQMMLDYVRAVQKADKLGQTILTAIDTETTGLNMLDLQVNNPHRDHIVSIPFGWEKDKAYVICTDMYYFHNVSEEKIYPLFQLLFSRNVDYTAQDIVLDWCGEHFEFNRKTIRTVGANVGFDTRAFLCHGCDIYFDDDIQVLHYNLATDYVQGRNSLKWMTHHYIGDQTLELEDLFGPQHKDKYRYLSDPQLALVYGGADADYPRILFLMLYKMTKPRLYRLYKKYDMTAVHRTAWATWKGMPVDEKAVKREGGLILSDMDTIKDFIYQYAYAANRGTLDTKAADLCSMLGIDSYEEFQDISDSTKMYRYKFTPANHKILLFQVLGYPVIKVSAKNQEPALDKYVLKKLSERKREKPVEFLKQSIMSAANPDVALIDKDAFNSAMYPLAQVFLKYSEINKEYTAYYKPIMTNDLESRMFYNFSLQRAATRRILSPGQTMKGSLKKLAIAPQGKLYMCFDASQIEYRHMASLAYIQTKELTKAEFPDDWEKRLAESGIARIYRMMQNEEADYHIETASMMTGLPQYKVDAKTRKMYKSIGFGIPYGLGDRSMCESLFGKITPENLVETQKVLEDYKARQFEIIRLLESSREDAFVPADISPEMQHMLDADDCYVSIVENFVGFYRLFFLKDITRAKKGRMRRQAGNCVIQGGAAELFRRMIYNFYMGCVQAGVADKVQWTMLVHDEVDTIIDDDLDVCKLIDIIYTGCTLRYQDQIPYYIGIGFGHNWYEAKGDGAELPVIMVERLLDAYHAGKFSIPSDGNQPEHLLKLKRHYMCDRIYEELATFIPKLGPDTKWTDDLVELVNDKFLNYTVRAYMSAFCTKEDKKQYGKDIPLNVQLERWAQARREYGFGVDFLKEPLVDARQAIQELDLTKMMQDDVGGDDVLPLVLDGSLAADDLELELLDNSSEEQALPDNSDFGQAALFDYNIPSDEVVVDDAEGGYRYYHEPGEEDNLVVNENPTSAFDLFVVNHYVRKHIHNTADGMYTAILSNTPYKGEASAVANLVRSQFETGTDTLILIDSNIRKVTGISCKADLLDQLDKLLDSKPT